jgi:2',3'-cyclic-nucleotide 2'-phosphodiesterase (5'-nucleotidase family)
MKKLIAAILIALPASGWSLTLDVFHTSDVHGWYSARPAKWDKENSTRTIGGFAALSALVNADKNPHILLDSGDTFQGTPEGNLTKGMATVTLMNQLGYSAAVVGNHDYDYGEPNLRSMIAASSFTWLGGNVYLKANGEHVDYLKPYTILNVAGKRIAVIGILGCHTATSTLPANVKHLQFRDEPQEAARITEEVKKAQARCHNHNGAPRPGRRARRPESGRFHLDPHHGTGRAQHAGHSQGGKRRERGFRRAQPYRPAEGLLR